MIWTRLAASLRFFGIDVGGPWVARWQPPVGDESHRLWQDIAARRVWRAELVSGWLESASATRTAADPATRSVDRPGAAVAKAACHLGRRSSSRSRRC